MKLVTIIPSIYGGGAEKLASDLSPYFEDAHEHLTYTYNESGKRYPYKGEVIDLNIPKQRSLISRLKRQLHIIKKLRIQKKENNTEVSISHMFMSNICNVLSRSNEKTICILHGEWCARTNDNFILAYITRYIYRKADLIVPVSHYIKEIFEKHHGRDHNIRVIHNGIDIESVNDKSLAPLTLDLPEKYIVMVGAHRPEKEYLDMLDHIKPLLDESEYKLVIVGDGPQQEEITKKIARLNLNDKVVLTGNLTNPYPVVRKASLFLLTSSTESFSLVLVEAMSLGIPVIATDCGGPGEILNPNKEIFSDIYKGGAGILIPTLDKLESKQLQAYINDVLRDQELCKSISKNGKERSLDFDIKNSAKNYLQAVKDLTRKN